MFGSLIQACNQSHLPYFTLTLLLPPVLSYFRSCFAHCTYCFAMLSAGPDAHLRRLAPVVEQVAAESYALACRLMPACCSGCELRGLSNAAQATGSSIGEMKREEG
jgi:hypothetical protein